MTYQPTGPFPPMPTGPMPAPPKQPRRGVTIALSAAIGVMVIVIAVVATMTIMSRKNSDDLPSITLQSVGTISDSPFTPTVAIGKEALSPAKVGTGNDRGVRGVTGTTPGLYGSATSVSCDTQRLSNYLRADAGAGQAWSSAMGVTTGQMPYYINTLTPVVLRTDAWVTNNLYRNGKAVPYQSILQAGTPVLVDRAGVPRVQCASGSPLAPPARAPLSGYRCSGVPWKSYQPTDVTVVDYRGAATPVRATTEVGSGYDAGAPVVRMVLHVVDIHTGAPREQPVGGGVSLAGLPPLRGRLPDPWHTNQPFTAASDEAARNNGLDRRNSDVAAPNVRARQGIPAPNPVSAQATVPTTVGTPGDPATAPTDPATETTAPTTETTAPTVPPVTTTTPEVTTPETVPPVTTTAPEITTPETTTPPTTTEPTTTEPATTEPAPPVTTTETTPPPTTEAPTTEETTPTTVETTTTTPETTEYTPPPTTEETTAPETTEETTVPTTE